MKSRPFRDPWMGAVFPTEGIAQYRYDENGRPIVKKNFPLLREAVRHLYDRVVRGEVGEQRWWFRSNLYDTKYRLGSPATWIRAFGIMGNDNLVHYYGWVYYDEDGELVWGKGQKAVPSYLGSELPGKFDRSLVALDYLADNGLWGPWSKDFDQLVVESLWTFYQEESA